MSSQSSIMRTGNADDASSLISKMFNSGNNISIVNLNNDNFLLWKFQVVTTLEGYDLEKYLDPHLEPLSQFLNVMIETPPATPGMSSSQTT
ncbi:uncharacterized protein E5676_scaffold298G001380 [Cucumis melo var. makuwa]|uniref:Uncharacterized protein n=1 Tax=Cucumis melo var. makuwa TaxID=1194695 RepID=A0A5D3BW27_CUCMM|nr:uncharacterized protein E5676_scaffold298G001380 [Cucumis melo var. makuwa]